MEDLISGHHRHQNDSSTLKLLQTKIGKLVKKRREIEELNSDNVQQIAIGTKANAIKASKFFGLDEEEGKGVHPRGLLEIYEYSPHNLIICVVEGSQHSFHSSGSNGYILISLKEIAVFDDFFVD